MWKTQIVIFHFDFQLSECPSATKFGRALAHTVGEYVRKCQHLPQSNLGYSKHKTPAILVVISDCETNIFDQRSIEEAVLHANSSITILRRTFTELAEVAGRAVVDLGTSRLFV